MNQPNEIKGFPNPFEIQNPANIDYLPPSPNKFCIRCGTELLKGEKNLGCSVYGTPYKAHQFSR
jgi:hypothetical protein